MEFNNKTKLNNIYARPMKKKGSYHYEFQVVN